MALRNSSLDKLQAKANAVLESIAARRTQRSDSKKDAEIQKTAWKHLFAFTTREHLPILVPAITACLIHGTIPAIQAIFVGQIYNSFTNFGGSTITHLQFHNAVRDNVLALVALAILSWILSSAFLALWIGFGELQARIARLRLFDGLLTKPISFYDTLASGSGGLSPRLQTQIRDLQLATSQPLGAALQSLATALACVIVAFSSSWSLTLILLGSMPLNALVISYISNRMQKHMDGQAVQLAIATKSSTNAFTNIEAVKCFNGQQTECDRFSAPIKRAALFYVRQVQGNALQMGWMMFATFITFLGGFYYGSGSVRSGKSTTADFITTFFTCLEVANAIKEILPQMLVLEKGRASGALLSGLLAQQETSKSDHTGLEVVPTDQPGEISFKNVSFAYPARPDHSVLKTVSCSFAAGETSFIIGQSGSGKSTVAQLLLRLYEPQGGDILLDETPIAYIDKEWLRKNITMVDQRSSMFTGTISENISLGAEVPESVTPADLKDATDFALLTNTLSDFPNGLDTIIGQDGALLSGGQGQRVALARARVRDSPILILDESTSALDHTSRSLVISAIRIWRRNKTTIFITHDVSQIESGDFVHLLEAGQVRASGYRWELEETGNEAFLGYMPSKSKRSVNDKSKAKSRQDARLSSIISLSTALNQESLVPDPLATASRRMSFIPSLYARGLLQTPVLFTHRVRSQSIAPVLERRLSSQSIYSRRTSSNTSLPLGKDKMRRWSDQLITGLPVLSGGEVRLLETRASHAIRRRETTRKRRSPPSDLEGGIGPPQSSPPQAFLLKDIISTIWPSLDQPARRTLVLALVCLLGHSASVPIFAYAFSKELATFYDRDGASQQSLKWAMVVLALSIIDGAATYFYHVGMERCSQCWVNAIRFRAMERILDQPKEFFEDDENTPSQLALALDRNADEMRNILGRFVSFFLSAVTMLLVATIWSLSSCWRLTLVTFSLTPVSWLLLRLFQIVSEKLESQSNTATQLSANIMNEAIIDIKVLVAYTLEKLFSSKHAKAIDHALRVGINRAIGSGVLFGISEACMPFVSCLMYYYGGLLVSNGTCSIAGVVLVFGQVTFALSNVSGFISMIPQISSSRDTATRLLYLATLPKESHEHQGTLKSNGAGDVVLDNVSFAYLKRPHDRVLNHLELTLRKNQATAIVGTTGCGKSTIAALLLRLYDTPSDIKINGTSLTSLSTRWIREHIAIVPQRPVLFPTTVSENITYGLSPDHAFNNAYCVRSAAAAAGIGDFLGSLPQGYETLIGDGGMGLSGGQAQRLAIARALVRNPGVLILDEATSALDTENSTLIRETLMKLMKDRPELSIVIITHERAMMELADHVAVLGKGRVLEEGTFPELLESNGRLASLLDGGVWKGGADGDDEEDADIYGRKRRPANPFVIGDDDRGDWSDIEV